MRTQCTSFATALTRFLTPQVWKQAGQLHAPKKSASRWNLHPLLMVLLLMTWTTGDSEGERFATARAFYVARHQHGKRPGQSLQGFQQALARVPLPVLHALFAALRQVLTRLYQRYWHNAGFVVMAVDGSRLECPRSAELEKRLGCCGKDRSAPMLYVTALVLLPAGLLWSWCVGPGTASEHEQLRQLLPTLPRGALLVADCFFQGYELYRDILRTPASFLVRLSSKTHLYVDRRQPLERFREGIVYYWPKTAHAHGKPPLKLRLIRVRGRKRQDVWLLTNVLSPQRLSRQQAGEFYRWRWQIEGVFRTYKRTLPKLKMCSRTEALAYREAEVSLLALQLLLAQQLRRQRDGSQVVLRMGSARQGLLRVRSEIITAIGARLGPRQQRWYRARLMEVRRGGPGRKVRRKWPKRKDHKPPKPPKLRVMPQRLKAKMNRHLDAA
jgi:Transposase DDE domain